MANSKDCLFYFSNVEIKEFFLSNYIFNFLEIIVHIICTMTVTSVSRQKFVFADMIFRNLFEKSFSLLMTDNTMLKTCNIICKIQNYLESTKLLILINQSIYF